MLETFVYRNQCQLIEQRSLSSHWGVNLDLSATDYVSWWDIEVIAELIGKICHRKACEAFIPDVLADQRLFNITVDFIALLNVSNQWTIGSSLRSGHNKPHAWSFGRRLHHLHLVSEQLLLAGAHPRGLASLTDALIEGPDGASEPPAPGK